MFNYKLIIQYDGGRYKGWQRLSGQDDTIQGKIEYVLSEMTGAPIEITGCSRTDGGVHALQQVANVKVNQEYDPDHIMTYCNRYLPQDISILAVTQVHELFHARHNAKEKTYLYQIWNEAYSNPFQRKYSAHVPETLDLDKMKGATEYLVGAHDFTAFSNAKGKKKSMIRTVSTIEIAIENGMVEIRVTGDGFLYNMVRRIVGTLILIGKGELSGSEIPAILESKERGRTDLAPAHGLFLAQIRYDG